MYSYIVLSKSNKINQHLIDRKDLDSFSQNVKADIRNLPPLISNLSDKELEDLEGGKEIVVTVQTTDTLVIKKIKT